MATGTRAAERITEALGLYAYPEGRARTSVLQYARVLANAPNAPDEYWIKDVPGRPKNPKQVQPAHLCQLTLAYNMARTYADAVEAADKYAALRFQESENLLAGFPQIFPGDTLLDVMTGIVTNYEEYAADPIKNTMTLLLIERNGFEAALLTVRNTVRDRILTYENTFSTKTAQPQRGAIDQQRMAAVNMSWFKVLAELWADSQKQLGLVPSGSAPASAAPGEGENADLPARKSAPSRSQSLRTGPLNKPELRGKLAMSQAGRQEAFELEDARLRHPRTGALYEQPNPAHRSVA